MSRSRGFSLVEVAVAVGLVAFALVALIGLFTVSMGTDHSGKEETILTTMTSSLVGELRKQSFDGLVDSTYYFDQSGTLQIDGNRTPITRPNASSIYQCEVRLGADPDCITRSPAEPPNTGERSIPNLYWAELKFGWPVTPARPVPPHQKSVHASVPRR